MITKFQKTHRFLFAVRIALLFLLAEEDHSSDLIYCSCLRIAALDLSLTLLVGEIIALIYRKRLEPPSSPATPATKLVFGANMLVAVFHVVLLSVKIAGSFQWLVDMVRFLRAAQVLSLAEFSITFAKLASVETRAMVAESLHRCRETPEKKKRR